MLKSTPTVDVAMVIGDLYLARFNTGDQVEVLVSVDLAQDNITLAEFTISKGLNSTQITRIDLWGHRVTARSKLDSFTRL